MHYVDDVLAAEFGYLSLKEWIEDLGRKLLGIRHRTNIYISAICSKYPCLLAKTTDLKKKEVALKNSPTTAMTVTTPADTPEFVAPNANYGRYFMANDARMYIGNVFVDELDSVQFVLQDNKIPVYSYSGRYFAVIGQGRSLVQGQIAINFISEGYLYAVLDNIQSSATSSNPQQDELNRLVAAQSNPGQSVLVYQPQLIQPSRHASRP
jgi:hypothetical protein